LYFNSLFEKLSLDIRSRIHSLNILLNIAARGNAGKTGCRTGSELQPYSMIKNAEKRMLQQGIKGNPGDANISSGN